MQRKWAIATAALAIAAVAAAAIGWNYARFAGRINALAVDLGEPAGYLSTPSLTRLSRDLVGAPVLRELLTEDFAFYYEAHEDRLGLAGAIKRIAFEHDTRFTDDLIALALDQPTELALWADDRGAARHWAMAMTRDALARVVQGLGALALKDTQLTLIADVPLAAFGLQSVPVYALSLSPRRTLAIASRGNRVVVLSDPGLLFDRERQPDGRAAKVLGALLSGDETEQGLWRHRFGLGAPAAGDSASHTAVVAGPLLSFGYQHFFPALDALRLEVAPGGAALRSFVRLRGDWPASPWAAVPAGAAACATVPIDWARARAVVGVAKEVGDAAPALGRMAQAFDGPAGVCWYGASQLHTPLFVAHAKGDTPDAETQAAFMAWWLPAGTEWRPDEAAIDIPGPYGTREVGEGSGYQAALRRVGDWWLFSPDATLVARAEDAIGRRYPSVADTLAPAASAPGAATASGRTPIAIAEPAQIAALLRREAMAVLPPSQAAFRQAAQTQLMPRLAAFGKLPPVQAVPQGQADAQGWIALDWRPVKAVKP